MVFLHIKLFVLLNFSLLLIVPLEFRFFLLLSKFLSRISFLLSSHDFGVFGFLLLLIYLQVFRIDKMVLLILAIRRDDFQNWRLMNFVPTRILNSVFFNCKCKFMLLGFSDFWRLSAQLVLLKYSLKSVLVFFYNLLVSSIACLDFTLPKYGLKFTLVVINNLLNAWKSWFLSSFHNLIILLMLNILIFEFTTYISGGLGLSSALLLGFYSQLSLNFNLSFIHLKGTSLDVRRFFDFKTWFGLWVWVSLLFTLVFLWILDIVSRVALHWVQVLNRTSCVRAGLALRFRGCPLTSNIYSVWWRRGSWHLSWCCDGTSNCTSWNHINLGIFGGCFNIFWI